MEPDHSGDDGGSVASVPAAPGVVATLVVHPPSTTLSECLDSLAAQDYPNLQVLALVTGSDPNEQSSVEEAMRSRGLNGHVRLLGGNPGFGRAANSVLRLVQGDGGFFLFLHDDVALDPDAVRLMVEELYRSNAGLIGPKFVEWDDPRRLHMVGFDADRFGELDSPVEEHEIDQEQHDAVRDAFVLPSACVLVRADLFRRMEGFEESIEFHGEDLDLCWRAHLMGARVVVAPSARVRHKGALADRRDDIAHLSLVARNRLATVASLTGAVRSLVTIPLLILITLIESVVSLVTGHVRRAITEFTAVVLAPRDTLSIIRRRRRIRQLREVSDGEIGDLQVRGSVRWRRLLRGRQRLTGSVSDSSRRRPETITVVAWGIMIAVLLVGGREILLGQLRPVGDLLRWSDSPRDVLHSYLTGWWSKDLGATTAQPTGNLLMALLGVVTLGHMALARTVLVVGLVGLGWLGASRLCVVATSARARIIGTVVYAAVPLPYAAVAAGRLNALVAYAALPWALHLVRLFGGLGVPKGSDESSRAIGDVIEHPSTLVRLRVVASLSIVLAMVFAIAPSVLFVVAVSVVLWTLAALLAGGSLRAAGLGIAATVVATSAAFILNLPWSTRYLSSDGWSALVGTNSIGGRDFWQLARFGIGPSALGGLVILLFVPALIAPFVSRGWRFVWAMRAAILIGASLVMAVVGETDVALPEPGVLLAPAAVGLSIGVAMAWVAFGADVRGARFGVRQPVALMSIACIPLGVIPAFAVASDGSWQQPNTTFSDQMSELLGSTDDFRVLVIGDDRLAIGASHSYVDGIAFSIIEGGRPTANDSWSPADDDVERLVSPLLRAVSEGSTDRVGRLLAPLGVKYVVIPIIDRVESTSENPLPPPTGLIDAFGAQLDFRRKFSPASMVVFENVQSIPITAMLTESGARASQQGGDKALAVADMSGAESTLTSSKEWSSPTSTIDSGTFHFGVPFDANWRLIVDGSRKNFDASFGSVMSTEIAASGRATLDYDSPLSRKLWVALQVLLWVIVIVAVAQPRRLRRRVGGVDGAPIMTIGGTP